MDTTIYNWICPGCDLRIAVPTMEQLEHARFEHVKAEHPEHLDEIEGCRCKSVPMIDMRLHYGAEDVAWVACRLCGEREEIPISPAIYPIYSDAEEAVEAMADVFSLTHFTRHRDALRTTQCPTRPVNPFAEAPER